ncbi:transposase, IS1 family, partial [Serratia symbiotica str. Tucson]
MLPDKKHITGKLYTQRVERENLTLRNRPKRLNRKTFGHSKSAKCMISSSVDLLSVNIICYSINQRIEYTTL